MAGPAAQLVPFDPTRRSYDRLANLDFCSAMRLQRGEYTMRRTGYQTIQKTSFSAVTGWTWVSGCLAVFDDILRSVWRHSSNLPRAALTWPLMTSENTNHNLLWTTPPLGGRWR